MKKLRIVLLAFTLFALFAPVHAQSNVSLVLIKDFPRLLLAHLFLHKLLHYF